MLKTVVAVAFNTNQFIIYPKTLFMYLHCTVTRVPLKPPEQNLEKTEIDLYENITGVINMVMSDCLNL